MLIQICVGSSCHLKGSQQIVEMLQKAVEEYHLQDEVTLAGSFCTGKCNREGVTVMIDDVIHTGLTPQHFADFFQKEVYDVLCPDNNGNGTHRERK